MKTLQQIRVEQILSRVLDEYASVNLQLYSLMTEAEVGLIPAAKVRRLSAKLLGKALRYSNWAKRIVSYYDSYEDQTWFSGLNERRIAEDNGCLYAMRWAGVDPNSLPNY